VSPRELPRELTLEEPGTVLGFPGWPVSAVTTSLIACEPDGETAVRLGMVLTEEVAAERQRLGQEPGPFYFVLEHSALLPLLVELERTVTEVLRLEAIARGIEGRDAMQVARDFTRRARRIGRQQAEEDTARIIAAAPGCSVKGCRRRVALLDEQGTRFCKRHAHELGLQPRGKIGGGGETDGRA
jgi:hypothetical protein